MLAVLICTLVVFALLGAIFGKKVAQTLFSYFVIFVCAVAFAVLSPGNVDRGFGFLLVQIVIASFSIAVASVCITYFLFRMFGVSENEIYDVVEGKSSTSASGCQTACRREPENGV